MVNRTNEGGSVGQLRDDAVPCYPVMFAKTGWSVDNGVKDQGNTEGHDRLDSYLSLAR